MPHPPWVEWRCLAMLRALSVRATVEISIRARARLGAGSGMRVMVDDGFRVRVRVVFICCSEYRVRPHVCPQGAAFCGFVEGECQFAPTFKVARDQGIQYTEQRIPRCEQSK